MRKGLPMPSGKSHLFGEIKNGTRHDDEMREQGFLQQARVQANLRISYFGPGFESSDHSKDHPSKDSHVRL